MNILIPTDAYWLSLAGILNYSSFICSLGGMFTVKLHEKAGADIGEHTLQPTEEMLLNCLQT